MYMRFVKSSALYCKKYAGLFFPAIWAMIFPFA